ncbi:Retrovirus-related Pol poly from transposon TNT 1-94, partial [Paramuricea clavata]
MLKLDVLHLDMCSRYRTTRLVGAVKGKHPFQDQQQKHAEYIALSTACQEAVRLRRFLSDIGLKQDVPSTIFEDNQGAIELSKNNKFHNRTKHIDVSFHFIREQVNRNIVCVKYCRTENMLADVMTKALPK